MPLTSVLPAKGAPRVLAVATLVNMLGNGLFFTASALYLTRIVGFSVREVGVGLTIAGLVGLFANVPAGRIAELVGPREVLVAVQVFAGLFMVAYAFVHSFWVFLIIACGELVSTNAANAVRNGLIATAVAGEDRVHTRAYLRSVTNLGIGLGSALAGVALHVDTRAAYMTLIIADAVTFVVTAALITRLPHVPPLPRDVGEGPRLVALRDRPYLSLVALNSLLCVHNGLLEIGVPLWVVRHTSAPRAMVAVIFVLNTAMCVLFQVRASRGVDDLKSSVRAVRRCGVLFLLACTVYGLTGGRDRDVAIVLLIVAELIHVTGELFQAAGSWGIGYGLAPELLQGQYQGLFSMSYAIANMLAPVIVTTFVVSDGLAGWIGIGVLFLVVAFATGPVGRWAEANRPALSAAVQPL
ncbi:MAG TPA: MFS transporter [Mycobacteriales bacterium]|nr:MFS transporter [Mycobacteriales bacterium]